MLPLFSRRPAGNAPAPNRFRPTTEDLECRIVPDAQFQAQASVIAANLNGVMARDQTGVATWQQQLQQKLLQYQVKASTGITNDEATKAIADRLYQQIQNQANASAAAAASALEAQKAQLENQQFVIEAQQQQTVQEIEALPPSRATDAVKQRLSDLENERATYETQQLNEQYTEALAMGDKATARQLSTDQAAVEAQREQILQKIDSLLPSQSTGGVEQQIVKQGNQSASEAIQGLQQDFKDTNAWEKQVTAEQQKEIEAAAAELQSTWKTMNFYERQLESAWKNADKAAVSQFNALLRRAQNDMKNALSKYKKALGILTQQEMQRQMQQSAPSSSISYDDNAYTYNDYSGYYDYYNTDYTDYSSTYDYYNTDYSNYYSYNDYSSGDSGYLTYDENAPKG